jgi:hypothetical protein
MDNTLTVDSLVSNPSARTSLPVGCRAAATSETTSPAVVSTTDAASDHERQALPANNRMGTSESSWPLVAFTVELATTAWSGRLACNGINGAVGPSLQ